ncbi:MAG: neutral/alkaline non-lysosomal ceramidase, partial [Hyphomicrobiales bacterium]|nr:neutral/alkaline non-lysosomal ceramidase [Hyphomicrobiales bacterium]
EPALGAHYALTARAVAVGDTAVLLVDVLGLHEDLSRRVRERCVLPADRVIVAGLHNHGGPAAIPGRAGNEPDPAYLQRLEDACVEAIDRAVAAQQPAEITIGMGDDPGVARNRRHEGGIVDSALPVLRIRGVDGAMIAVVTSYACHPVVLGADNRLWTADYPHFVRAGLEVRYPGAIALFLTGCTGDANTGHSAHASISLAANESRTFAAAERHGLRIAAAAAAADEGPAGTGVRAANTEIALGFKRLETTPLPELVAQWKAEMASADPVRAVLLKHWISWAETTARQPLVPWRARVTALLWGGVPIVALPGEIFAETGLAIRSAWGDRPAFVISYAEAMPGYIPPASEFRFGGYEVDEAHRFIGMPATFASGSAEALAEAAIRLLNGFEATKD